MANKSSRRSRREGGVRGFFLRAGKSFYSGGLFLGDSSWWIARKAARVGFIVVTSAMFTFMPLMLLIAREGQMIEMERIEAKELQARGYSLRQLQELGFNEAALHSPSVAALQKK